MKKNSAEDIKRVRKAAFKVVRESEKIHGYSNQKVDDAIQDLARVLRGKDPYDTYSLRGKR